MVVVLCLRLCAYALMTCCSLCLICCWPSRNYLINHAIICNFCYEAILVGDYKLAMFAVLLFLTSKVPYVFLRPQFLFQTQLQQQHRRAIITHPSVCVGNWVQLGIIQLVVVASDRYELGVSHGNK